MRADDIVVIGVGETPVGRLPGQGATQLQARAALSAIADAGLALHDVDGVVNQDPYAVPEAMFALTLTEYLGLSPSFVQTVDVGGSVTTMAMLQTAAWAVRDERCRFCLVVSGENMATSRAPGAKGHMNHSRQGGDPFKEPWGVQGAVIPYALVARRYCHETGLDADRFGHVAIRMREHALRGPNRQTRRPLTLDEYLASPMISDPLRHLDCSLVSDGAAAFVVTRRDRIAGRDLRPVTFLGLDMHATHCSIAQQPDLQALSLPRVARRFEERVGRGIADFDLHLVHDAFTFSLLIQLEQMGLSEPGRGIELFESGAVAPEGARPVNPHGGLLSQAHFGGALHGVEAVRQVRGDAAGRQVPGARSALWCGNGGILSVFGITAFTSETA